jgi:nucleotide-binding universal stress UspA family protein
MTFTTLMVQLQLAELNTGLLEIAGSLAERYQASVIGVAVCQPMQVIYGDGYVMGDLIQQDRDEIKKEIDAAEVEFRSALATRVRNLEWRSSETFAALSGYLAYEARSADLILTSMDRSGSLLEPSRHANTGDLIMQAGRPVLVVPAGTNTLKLEHVMVGWKDTRETRRAISDALPLLKSATHVTLVEIAAEEALPAARAHLEDVTRWLKRHGIEAASIVSLSTGDDAIRLNTVAREKNADIIVAGAYGHSRLREWVLGGVTRDLLLRAERCAFMSH